MKNPRGKLIWVGDPKKLKTEELLSIIIGSGTSKINVFDLSSQIVKFLRSKNNDPITIEDLEQFDGIGKVKAMQIISALELGRRYYYPDNIKLSANDWDFADLKQSERQYGVHFFHHYTAKFIPQIPARIIRHYTTGNNIVVDPFMGSGTTLVEAKLLGCNSFGLDTNPMAIKIAKAKTLKIDDRKIKEINDFIEWLELNKKSKGITSWGTSGSKLFNESELWFREDVASKINSILSKSRNYSPEVRNFIEVGLSTLLKGMSNARMDSVIPVLPNKPIYLDRKHYYREVNNLTRKIPVFRRVLSQIRRMKFAILAFNKEIDHKLICEPTLGDARRLQDFIGYCDLVVTSPPYWSAQNYEKIHMLSMKLFSLDIERGQEIGRDENTYLSDMKLVFQQIANILHGHFAIVIGHDNRRQTHERLFQIIKEIGFIHVDTITRRISNQVSRAKQIKSEYIFIFKI
jgi:site-specific DNA-methyltransferase (cytosine-N4-specific)